MNKKILYPIALLMLGLGLALAIAVNKPATEPEPYDITPTTVRVMKVVSGPQYLTIKSQGTVQPRSQSELLPEVSGRVTWISPALVAGGAFKKDDILLRIDDADYRTLVQRSEAALERAKVEYSYAQDELKRLQSLFKQKLASQKQLDDAHRAERVAKATLTDSKAALEQARRDLERTLLRAPFDGLVRDEEVDLGQFVSRGQRIATVYASDAVEIRLPISADQLAYLGLPISTRGQIPESIRPPVTVTVKLGGTTLTWQGNLVRLEAVVDERTRMVYGVALIQQVQDGTLPLLPVGMFVQAEIRGQRVENVIRLPRSAMRDNSQVLIVDADNRLHYRAVQLLRLEHDDMLIQGGLKDGETVCISPLQAVVEGMHVNTVEQ